MPWEGCELYVLEDGELTLIAGGADEAIVQPEWGPDGELYYCSDRTNWWNLYRGDQAITALEAEVGGPMWEFGESYYTFLDDGRIAVVYSSDGLDHLALVEDGTIRELPLELTRIVDLHSDGARLLLVGAKPTQTSRVLRLDPATGELETLSSVGESMIPEAYVSVPRPVSFPTAGGRTAHAVFYPPLNPDVAAPEGELPPLIVRVHGGPTAHVGSTLTPTIQFFTSRGFAVVDVNYGGSTGYGREYRERLRGTWGVVDVEDCVNCARHLASIGEVDGDRMAITGGSAGGWTVLAALCFHPDAFACGADYFGVAELAGMAADTHKFESRYLDYLIPRELWDERSPLNHADQIRAPVIVLQGAEDAVVPPSQSEQIVAALRANGIRCEYLLFEGEQHGFRKAENIVRAIEAELDFYRSIFDR
jgi:dipeptidyl aminopeptidase/acylaminoacyl peptidase